MPSDITGSEILDEHKTFRFNRGHYLPTSFWLMRLTEHHPKHRLHCSKPCKERSVTVSGTKHLLAKPFFVLATQNPIEQEGTYPLPKHSWTVLCSTSNLTTPAIREELNVVKKYYRGYVDKFKIDP